MMSEQEKQAQAKGDNMKTEERDAQGVESLPDEEQAAPPRSIIKAIIALVTGNVVLIWLDQWSKAWAAKALYTGSAAAAGGVPTNPGELYTRVIEVYSWFNFRLVGNKGAAWGIFKDLPETVRVKFFVALSVVALFALLWLYFNSYGQRMMQLGLILISGGAVGNLIDRIQIGYVVDFIDWHINNHHWPTFNVADIAISVGVGVLIIDIIMQSFRERAAASAE
jgi:signal peptidase II